jgi:hypothetical protein
MPTGCAPRLTKRLAELLMMAAAYYVVGRLFTGLLGAFLLVVTGCTVQLQRVHSEPLRVVRDRSSCGGTRDTVCTLSQRMGTPKLSLLAVSE